MCRFLMIKSHSDFQPGEILVRFSEMVKNSKTLDGDWQGDGWGIGWLDENQRWQFKKTIHPIWEDECSFRQIPESKQFLVHARSASFPKHKNNLDFNQPFTNEKFAFLFNGLIKGVSLPFPTYGKIGAQKIWHLLNDLMSQSPPEVTFLELQNLLIKYSLSIQAMNIGLSDGKMMYAFCHYEKFPDYYNLRYHESNMIRMICSEPLIGYAFEPVPLGRTVIL